MNYFNYKISGTKGKMYLSSKDPQEGYTKVEFGTKKDPKVTYHKYVDRVKGLFSGFATKEVEFDNKKLTFLEVTFTDGDDINKISVNLKTPQGNVSNEAKGLISSLYGAEVNKEYSVSCTVKVNHSNGKDYKNLNIYVNSTTELNEAGRGMSTGYISYTDVPKAIKEDDGLGGFTYNNKDVNAFWGGKIKEISVRFEGAEETVKKDSPKKDSPKKETTSKMSKPLVDANEADDLPF